jgi:hypothetical protein
MTALPAIDERDAFGLLIDPVSAGLAHLERCAPLWGDRASWAELLVALGAFHARWTGPCRVAGWSDVQLLGLDPDAPYARVGRMGAAWLACTGAHCVVSVDPVAIRVVARTAARHSIYRPAAGGVLAWNLRQEVSAVPAG